MTTQLGTETTQIEIRHSGGDAFTVDGRIITPGLAITPSPGANNERKPRYVLTHIPSGLTAGPSRCAEHIGQAAQLAIDLGIDWNADQQTVVDALKAANFGQALMQIGFCRDHCSGDGPEPKSWSVRCNTCDWYWEDEYGEGPLDAKNAKQMARDHECEPHVELAAPDSDLWISPHLVDDDGTVREPEPRMRRAGAL